MITSLEHWATSGLLFFSLLLRLSYLRLFYLVPPPPPYLSLLLPSHSSPLVPSHQLYSLSANAAEAKLSFDALRIRFPVEFCGDKGSKPFPGLPTLIHATGSGAYNIVKRPVSHVSPRFTVAFDLLLVSSDGNWKTGRNRCSFDRFEIALFRLS